MVQGIDQFDQSRHWSNLLVQNIIKDRTGLRLQFFNRIVQLMMVNHYLQRERAAPSHHLIDQFGGKLTATTPQQLGSYMPEKILGIEHQAVQIKNDCPEFANGRHDDQKDRLVKGKIWKEKP